MKDFIGYYAFAVVAGVVAILAAFAGATVHSSGALWLAAVLYGVSTWFIIACVVAFAILKSLK